MNIEKSLEMLEEANRLRSNDGYITDSLGWALYKLGKFEKAKEFLQSAVQLMPSDPIINDHFADSLWMNGEKLQARYYWKYVLNLEDAEDKLKNEIKEKLLTAQNHLINENKIFFENQFNIKSSKKIKNGMHQVETNSSLINIFDEIKIIKAKKDEVIFEGEFKKKISSKKTIVDTLQILRKLGILKYFYKIIVKKNIPVFAGLGGGTSNSAFLVKHFVKNKINEKLINIFEKKIGSDFRLFLNNCSFQKKLGKVLKTKNNFSSYILIVFPNIDCKTKKIYKLVKNFSLSSGNLYLKKVNQNKFLENIQKDRNDLQKIVEKKYLKILKLIELLSKLQGRVFQE